MEMKHVSIGLEVDHPKFGRCTVELAEKGWVTINDGEATHKVRAKDIEVADDTPYSMSKQLAKYRNGYQPTVSYSGSKSHHKGDEVSNLLAGSEPAVAIAVAEKVCDFKKGELADKYGHLNPGQQRMNAGNRVRAAIKRGDVTFEQVAKIASKVS